MHFVEVKSEMKIPHLKMLPFSPGILKMIISEANYRWKTLQRSSWKDDLL